jgi:hypothetical protein
VREKNLIERALKAQMFSSAEISQKIRLRFRG